MTTALSVANSPTSVALEEHWWLRELAAALERLPPERRDDTLTQTGKELA
jgi:hypothetical protein